MKVSTLRFLSISITSVMALSSSAFAVDRIKQNNTNALNLAASWDTLPTSSDVVVWNSTVTAANSTALGADLSWAGIKIAGPGGLVTVTHAAGQTLTLGTSGIDMSAATQNLSLMSAAVANTAGTLAIGGNQTWNVASGRTLNLFSTSNSANQRLSGSGNIQVSGGGTVTMNVGDLGSTTFAAGNGNDTYTGNWTISGGSKVLSLRNGTHGWGTGSITLDNGTISQQQGNWSWSNNIAIGAGGGKIYSDSSGNARYLNLTGVISGSNTLTFDAISAMSTNEGFILTGSNTFSGSMVINANGTVRIGGDAGTGANSTNAGTLGSISSSVGITNNGILGFGWTDAHTVANVITGSGIVRLGRTGGVVPSTQTVTLSGASTYTGGTQVNAGRMNLTGSLTSAVSVASAAKISGTGSTTGLLTMAAGSSIALAGGGTTTSLTVNGVTFSGATTVTFDAPGTASTNYDVLSYGSGTVTNPGNLSVAWRGTLANDTTNKKFVFTTGSTDARTWSAASGTWDVYASANFAEGDSKFISGDTVTFNEPASASTVTLSGRLSPASVTVNNTSNGYTFSGVDGTADITGSGSLTKSGAGALTITSAQTYTGATSVNAGTLKFTGTGSVGSTSGISLASGAVFEWGRDAAVNRDFSGSGTISRSTTTGNAVFSGNNSGFTGSWNITSGYVGLASDGTVGASGVGMTWNGGGIFFNGTGNTLSSSRTITLGASGGTLNGSTGNTNTFAANFTGTGNLNKVSGEKAILTAVNDFTGNINISGGGTLEIGGAGQFGNGSYAGTISIGGGNTFSVNTSADQTLSGVVSGGGSLNKGSSGALALTTANTFTGTTTIGGGKLTLGTGASLYSTGGFFGASATTNVFINSGGTLETRNWNYGAGNAFNEMRANSYAIRINGGTVRFTENTGSVRGFQVGAGGATLEAASGVTYTKLAGDVPSDNIIQGVSGGSLTLTGAGNGEIADAIGSYGTWSASAGVTKSGAGTWILSGNNTYAGTTDVNGGSLRVNGIQSGTGAVNVASGASLGGSGSVAGAVNVSGVLAPGNSIESLGTGTLSFATGSTFAYELDSSSLNGDLVASTGTLGIASGAVLSLTELASGSLLNGSKLTLISYAGGWNPTELFTYLGGTLADDSTFTLNGNEWLFNYNDISGGSNFSADQSGASAFVTMTVVPEPAAALLGGIGLICLLRRRR